MDPSSELLQALHKACGSVDVAKDLLGRSETVYAQTSVRPDSQVVDCFERAAIALALVAEALRGQLRAASFGPAA